MANGRYSRRGLIVGGVAVLALAGFSANRWAGSGADTAGEILSAEEAHSRATRGDIVLVDIRRPDEWARTGVPAGAQPLDMRREDFVAELKDLVDGREIPVALICARGVRSQRLADLLQDVGLPDVYDVSEGMLGSGSGAGWLRKGLPVTAYAQDPA